MLNPACLKFDILAVFMENDPFGDEHYLLEQLRQGNGEAFSFVNQMKGLRKIKLSGKDYQFFGILAFRNVFLNPNRP